MSCHFALYLFDIVSRLSNVRSHFQIWNVTHVGNSKFVYMGSIFFRATTAGWESVQGKITLSGISIIQELT